MSASRTDDAGRPPAIFVWFTGLSPGFHDRLARRLKARFGWDTVLLCNAAADLPGEPRFDRAAFAEIVDMDPLVAPTPKHALPPVETLARDLEAAERRLGLNFNEIMRADRHLGRDFVKGAWYARSRYGLSADYEQTMDIVLRLAGTFEALIARWRPRAIVAMPALASILTLFQVARACGVPWRALVQSRLSTRFYFSDTADYLPLGFGEALARALAAPRPADDAVSLPAPTPALAYFAGLRRRAGLGGLLRAWYGTLRGKLPARFRRGRRVYGNYLIRDELWAAWRLTWALRRGLGRKDLEPPLAPGQPYVLYPLQVEPESSIMAEAGMADNQLAVIDLLARTLPAGWRLVVKEHPAALGHRPPGFDRRVRGYPNVTLAPAFADAEALVNGARCVAAINSTVAVQAAVAGVPVVTFHPNSILRGLPHVQCADSYATLRQALCRVRDGDMPAPPARIAAGRAWCEAMRAASFELDEPRLVLNDRSLPPPGDAALDVLIDHLMASLETAEPAEADRETVPRRRA